MVQWRLPAIPFMAFCCLLGFFSCRNDDPKPSDYPGEHRELSLEVDNRDRNLILYLPSTYDGITEIPLIFVLHGGGGKPWGMFELADFRPIAERDTVALVYPEGIDKAWNDGRPSDAGADAPDDVEFFRQMCIYLRDNFAIDTSRIYATGISNGGFMSSRLGCELSDWIAAIAVDAATIEANTIAPACNPGRVVPAMYIHGTEDGLVPIEDGEMTVGNGGFILSHAASLQLWAGINACDSLPETTNLPDIADDGTTITETRYLNGTNGAEVVGYVVTGGGHTWPQGKQYLRERIIGKTSQDMNGCEEVWAFLRRWQR